MNGETDLTRAPRWERIQELFHAAADLAPADQGPFLASACAGADGLLGDVLALLKADAHASSPLDRDIGEVARELLARPLKAATQLGAYRIERTLGEGGMGVVYLAERKDLRRWVAIKVLRDPWRSEDLRERFAAEQRTLAQLEHSNIARLYDSGVLEDGTPFFVMEFVEGEPITEHCREGRATLEERLRLFRSLCEAVQAAHAHAVIHRDIKPSNVLVKRDGGVRLLDFGIAKQLERVEAKAHPTRTGLRMMTPAYAAPEQFRGAPVGIHTDVYSLGVLLYELLAGRLPFDLSRASPAEAEALLVGREPAKPSAASEGAPHRVAASRSAWADLDVLVLKAMHKDPQRRYRSVESLIRDIDHFLGGEPLDARPDSLGYRLRKFVSRHRRAVLASAGALSTVIALIAAFTVRLAGARDAALAEVDRRQRVEKFMLSLFEGGEEKRGVATDLRVLTLLEEGKKQVGALAAQPEIQADFQNVLGKMFLQLDRIDDAEALLGPALATRRRLLQADGPALVESLSELSRLRAEQRRLEAGEALALEAVTIARRHPEMDEPTAANAALALANVLRLRGQHARSIETLEELLHRKRGKEMAAETRALVLSNLSMTHGDLGHYDRAIALNRQALALFTQLYGESHPTVADRLDVFADIAHFLDNEVDAERTYRQALAINTSWFGPNAPAVASDLLGVGDSLVDQNRLEEAEGFLDKALAIQERAYGPNHARVSEVINALGRLAHRRGDLALAAERFRRVVEISRATYGERHAAVAIASGNLGDVLLAQERWAEAESTLRRATEMCVATASADNVACARNQLRLGRALVAQGRYAEAEATTLAAYRVILKVGSPKLGPEARKALAAIYRKLGKPAETAKYEAEPR